VSQASALRRPAASALVTAARPLPDDTDALALLAVVPEARRFYWERRNVGAAVAAVGEALVVQSAGPERFARAAAVLEEIGPLADGAVAVGGFAFDADPRRRGTWREFPSCEWVVPRLAVVRRDGATRLVGVGADPAALHAEMARVAPRLADASSSRRAATRYQAFVRRGAADWRRAVERTLEDIAACRLEKLVLARTAHVRADVAFDAVRVARRLRRAYPRCAVFLRRAAGATLVGASPECLARRSGDALVTAAVAGTTARGADPAADATLAAALLASPKERAEHALVVEDVRARLADPCLDVRSATEPGVFVTETVQHLHTPFTARLRPGRGLLDAAAALHPTAAVCGAPRAGALAALRRRERLTRGWYGGGVGWLAADGGEISVAIRTALLQGRLATLWAGAGIVAGSTWEAELEETRLKLRPLLNALVEL
jgi:menaquinone-specific isochorismate synthase